MSPKRGAAFVGGPIRKTPRRLVASKIPFPEGLKYFGWIARRRGGFRLGRVPKEKEREVHG